MYAERPDLAISRHNSFFSRSLKSLARALCSRPGSPGSRLVGASWSDAAPPLLTPEARVILFMGATFAALRLERLIEPAPRRYGDHAALTPRELSVLRLMSIGHQVRSVANLLELGEETIRTHLKKAQAKLGVHNRAHAVAQAIRRRLIP